MTPVVEKTRFSKEIYAQAARRTLDFPHLTHSVGMSVHDVGTYKTGAPLPPGLVFALDPQLIIPEERLYIRVEDTVVVTDRGVENLNSLAPLDLSDVERTMREAPPAVSPGPKRP
jgi:Xaa-Pro aminopeptidase